MKHGTKLVIVSILYLMSLSTAYAQQKPSAEKNRKQILLIGTFHFDNPGADLVKTKTFDINGAAAQKDLNVISDQIKRFAPDQFFVEWDYHDEKALDSLYDLYLNGSYHNYIKNKFNPKQQNYYNNSETFQLAFRASKNSGLKKVRSMDYQLSLPFDSVMTTLKAAGQTEIIHNIQSVSAAMAARANTQMQKLGLRDLIIDYNSAKSRKENAGFYIQNFNRAGRPDNFIGADMVADWYRRNLYMYALLQKQLKPTDRRLVILVGAGHAAILKKFIEDEGTFEVVELKDLK